MTKATEKDINVKQIPFRLHPNDKALFFKLLGDDNLSFQKFVDACMQAYLRGDPSVVKIIKDWRTLNEVPKDHLERYTLSHRERAEIQRELEMIQKDNP